MKGFLARIRRAAVSLLLLILGAVGVIVIPLVHPDAKGTAVLGSRAIEVTRIEGESWPKRLIDPSGVEQILPGPPQRIVSTFLGADEIILTLLADEPERIAAVTSSADDTTTSNCADLVPPGKARYYSTIESALEVEPDLIIAAGMTRAAFVRTYVSAGIPVIRAGLYYSMEDLKGNFRLIGKAIGKEKRAAVVVTWMEDRIKYIEEKVVGRPKPRVLYWNPNGFTTGRNSTMGEMMTIAGAINVAEEAGIDRTIQLPIEFAVSLEPEVILISSRAVVRTYRGIEATDSPVQEILHDPQWKDAPAVRNGRVYAVKAAWLNSISHYPIVGLEAMARVFHPEAFPEGDVGGLESALLANLHETLHAAEASAR